jgi:hypothetical protein
MGMQPSLKVGGAFELLALCTAMQQRSLEETVVLSRQRLNFTTKLLADALNKITAGL